MKKPAEKLYRVHFEASAAVGFEVQCNAASPEAAEAYAEGLQQQLVEHFERVINNLMCVDPNALQGYCDVAKPPLPIVYATVAYAPDDAFEVTDTSEAA